MVASCPDNLSGKRGDRDLINIVETADLAIKLKEEHDS